MQKNIDLDFEHYRDFDFSGAKHISDPKILEARARKKEHDTTVLELLDSDVQEVIRQHNTPKDRERLNTVIRALFATV